MRREGADSPDRLFGLFPLTIMVRIPRYRLTVGGRSPKSVRVKTSHARSPVQQWTEVNLSKTKAILNV